MESACEILLKLGASPDRILQESFGGIEPATESCPPAARFPHTVVFIQSQKVCQVSTLTTLLEAAESKEVQISYGCRQGLCGTCATRVLSGAVQMDVEAGLTAEQKDAGYVLPSVSRAKGTVVLAA